MLAPVTPRRSNPPRSPAPRTGPTPGPLLPGPATTHATTGTSAVALTFDDGPTWTWTEQMLTVLREAGVKATFCVLGKMARTYPERIRQIVRDGHTLCNHGDIHDTKLGTRSAAEIRANLQAANDAIHAAAPDAKIPYFRHPGGAWTPAAIDVAKELGMTALHWDVDPRDWERPGADAIYTYVTTHARPGSIVLMHDGGGDRSGTVEAVRRMLPVLKARFSLIALPSRGLP
jgi:peptidoglycan/xylan/chitin deacetylase (PgdA/CDA1 family)